MVPAYNNYLQTLSVLKERIRLSRQNAALAVNHELLNVYWEIGNTILQQQKERGWGKNVINQLAADLKTAFPDMKGLSPRNLRNMKVFTATWPEFSIWQPPAAKLKAAEYQEIERIRSLLAKMPWAHHIIIISKTKSKTQRLFYIEQAIKNGWSKSMLLSQVKSQLHLRQGNAITNFEHTLPSAQSDLARETLKNPYLFDFLGIEKEMQEKELERALMVHIKRFLLELGRGFAYVGNQYNLTVEDDEFFMDLLFYNYHLHCFVVFELKAGNFKPEYTGKLNFYINTVDEQIKGKTDSSTIGVLLCKTPNDTVIKYALKGINTPIGIAGYEFTNALPKKLEAEMPTVEELEAELEKETRVFKKKAGTTGGKV